MVTEQPTQTASSPMKTYLPRIIIALVLLVGGYFGFNAYQHSQQFESTDNAQIEGNSAPVLARVAGYVTAVNVADYTNVTQGQPLVTIDPQEYTVALQQAEADYQSTLGDLATARADLATAYAADRNGKANVQVAQSNAEVQAARRNKAQADLARDQNLYQGQSLTQKQLDDSRNNAEVQARQLNAAEQQVAQARVGGGLGAAGIQRAQAAIQKIEAVLNVKQAAIESAKLRLSYAQVKAPIAGKIGRKNVVAGQYVQPGQSLLTIVADSTFWVVANFKETQLEKVRIGQEVDIKLDAYPDLAVKGRVASLAEATGAKSALLPADNASGNFVKITQRVPVKIEILNPERYKEQLRAGLSVEAEVKVK